MWASRLKQAVVPWLVVCALASLGFWSFHYFTSGQDHWFAFIAILMGVLVVLGAVFLVPDSLYRAEADQMNRKFHAKDVRRAARKQAKRDKKAAKKPVSSSVEQVVTSELEAVEPVVTAEQASKETTPADTTSLRLTKTETEGTAVKEPLLRKRNTELPNTTMNTTLQSNQRQHHSHGLLRAFDDRTGR